MSDFKTRLIDEKAQLNERIEKLEAFQKTDAFQGISPIQQSLLNVQLNAMYTYAQILIERIAWTDDIPLSNTAN